MTALALAALALALSLAAPVVLVRLPFLRDVPRAAVTLWQACALAAVLAAVGAALAAPEEVLRALQGDDLAHDAWLLAAASVAALLAGWIVFRLVSTAIRLGVGLRRRRRRQHEVLALLATTSPSDARLHVLGGSVALAYCVPGRPSRVVVTEAVVALLTQPQVEAVVEHERAHLRARHDLVLEGFTALHASFPRFVRSRLALEEVRLLLEMLADDAATRRTGAPPLLAALTLLEPTTEGDQVRLRRERIARLDGRDRSDGAGAASRRLVSGAAYALAVGVIAVPTVTIVTPWLRTATAALGW